MVERNPMTGRENSSDERSHGCPEIDSRTLLQGRPEVTIRHNGRVYRLRATRLGKLILTA